MKLYGLKSCDTCKKALKALQGAGKDVVNIDVRTQGVSPEEMQLFFETFGEKLVNTRSTTWRNMSEEDRQMAPVELLLANPTLMKRPVIDDSGTLYLSWSKEVQSAVL